MALLKCKLHWGELEDLLLCIFNGSSVPFVKDHK